MQENEPSKTARRVAVLRAEHQLADKPVVFEDPLALTIIGAKSEARLRADLHKQEQSPHSNSLRAFVAARSRYAEDALRDEVANGLTQFVVLGAGLDTFAYRNPYPELHVFEVDYPATQAWKRGLLAGAALALPTPLTFVPVDFETQTLAEGLRVAGLNFEIPVFLSWLGVTPYLTVETTETTFQFVASLAKGSSLVFDYGVSQAALTARERIAFDYMSERVALAGEPWRTFFDPAVLADDLHRYGFSQVEDLDGVEINRRYFAGRMDGLMVGNLSHLMLARV